MVDMVKRFEQVRHMLVESGRYKSEVALVEDAYQIVDDEWRHRVNEAKDEEREALTD